MTTKPYRPISSRMANRLGKVLREAARSKDQRERMQPHLQRVAVSARQLREHLVDTVRILSETTDFARDIEQDIAVIEATGREEVDLATEQWDDIAQLATIASRMDDVFYVYDSKLWTHLLKTVNLETLQEAIGLQTAKRAKDIKRTIDASLSDEPDLIE